MSEIHHQFDVKSYEKFNFFIAQTNAPTRHEMFIFIPSTFLNSYTDEHMAMNTAIPPINAILNPTK